MSRIVNGRFSRSITALTAAAAALAATAAVTIPAQGASAPAAIVTRGYAYVNHSGVVSRASGLSQANVVTAGGSSYCFKGLAFTPNNIQATLGALDNAGVAADKLLAGLGTGGSFTGCPTGTQAFVVTVTPSETAAKNGFFILIH